jgi:hypothetical protein
VLLLGLAGCGDKVCAGLPLARIAPAEVTIAVGQTLTPRYQDGGYCAGNGPTEADYRTVLTHWTTNDTAVVSLDSLTGTVTGRAPGDARVAPVANPNLSLSIHDR